MLYYALCYIRALLDISIAGARVAVGVWRGRLSGNARDSPSGHLHPEREKDTEERQRDRARERR